MQYKLVKLDSNNPNDQRFIAKGLVYKLEMASKEDIDIMNKIKTLVNQSRNALRDIYSGALTDEEFDANLALLKSNDDAIQSMANQIGIEMSYLNPWANGQGFIED